MHFPESVFFLIALTYSVNGNFRDVLTDQGKVRGYNSDANDVYTFYGIPYATAPTGEDRFKAALPPPTWDGVFNGTERHILCPQKSQYHYKTYIMMDCLRLHVFVPDTRETNLPVYFFIHGGGHQFGHPSKYVPLDLVRRGMIVVNLNYRVGVYGFLCLNTEFAPGNAGMKDQVMALRWVQRNIANFGGDPKKITIGGVSSGSACVDLHVLSPMSKGLIHRAMPNGGSSGIADIAFAGKPLEIAEKHANRFGAITNQNVSKLESFYRSLSDDQLEILYKSNYKEMGFAPCVETHNVPGVEKFLAEKPIDILLSGNYEKIPIMTGYTPMDGLFYLIFYAEWKPLMVANFTDFVPSSIPAEKRFEATEILRDFYFPTGEITYLGFVNYFTDLAIAYPMYAFARLYARNHALVYLYLLSFNGTVNLPDAKHFPIWGPGHAVTLLYTQSSIDSFVYDNMTEEEFVVQKKLLDLCSNFVKNGVPYSKLVDFTWTPMSSSNAEYLQMDREFHMDQFPLKDRLQIWERFYNYPYTNSAITSTLPP